MLKWDKKYCIKKKEKKKYERSGNVHLINGDVVNT